MNIILLISLLVIAESKIYNLCDLAKELIYRHNFSKEKIDSWICLIKHESEFNTTAKGGPNTDGSFDHGLFQINDRYWCQPPFQHNECDVKCDDLRNDDISDDVRCARKIFSIHGFHAWIAWKHYCNGKDLSDYIINCNV